MQVEISFPTGFTVAGALVAGTNTELRIAMRGWDDIAVFHAAGGDWLGENGDRVQIDFHPASSSLGRAFFEMFVYPVGEDAAIPSLLTAPVAAWTN